MPEKLYKIQTSLFPLAPGLRAFWCWILYCLEMEYCSSQFSYAEDNFKVNSSGELQNYTNLIRWILIQDGDDSADGNFRCICFIFIFSEYM